MSEHLTYLCFLESHALFHFTYDSFRDTLIGIGDMYTVVLFHSMSTYIDRIDWEIDTGAR